MGAEEAMARSKRRAEEKRKAEALAAQQAVDKARAAAKASRLQAQQRREAELKEFRESAAAGWMIKSSAHRPAAMDATPQSEVDTDLSAAGSGAQAAEQAAETEELAAGAADVVDEEA